MVQYAFVKPFFRQRESVTSYKTWEGGSQDVVSDGCGGKRGSIGLSGVGVYGYGRDSTIWRAGDVRAEDEKSVCVECFAGSHQRTPPIRPKPHICVMR